MSKYLVRTKSGYTTVRDGVTLPFDYISCMGYSPNLGLYNFNHGWSEGFRSHATIFENKKMVHDFCKLYHLSIDNLILEKQSKFCTEETLMADMRVLFNKRG